MVNFLIIGSQKGGSTWLYDNIRTHPGVYTPKNELHFFSSNENYRRGIDWYHSHFVTNQKDLIWGEKTPEYLTLNSTTNQRTNHETHKRIFAYNKDMKLIVVLREPVGRLRSAINHMYRTRRIPPWVSADDLLFGSYKIKGEEFSLLENGQYYENLAKYLEIFPKAQLKILFFETDIVKRPLETLKDTCSFLDIPFRPDYFPMALAKKNEYQMSRPALILNYLIPPFRFFNNRLNHIFPPYKVKLRAQTEQRLFDFYRMTNQKLKELTGSIPPNWDY